MTNLGRPLTCPPSPFCSLAREKLDDVARTVYQKMDQLFQGKMYSPGEGLGGPKAGCAHSAVPVVEGLTALPLLLPFQVISLTS